jgi:hypothetical protein
VALVLKMLNVLLRLLLKQKKKLLKKLLLLKKKPQRLLLEQILNQAVGTNNDLYIIGWTWIDRFDYTTPDNRWQSILPVDTTDTARVYYRDLHSEYRDKFTCLSYIRLAIDTLKQRNIPYIMTYMDDLLFDQRWHITPAVVDLQSYIQPEMTRFEDKSFLEWSSSYGYPETAAWHPLETAHKAAAD